MGFRVDARRAAGRGGFDRLLVLGLRARATTPDEARPGARGAAPPAPPAAAAASALVPQGTPTNNTEAAPSGYDRRDDADASFDDRPSGAALRSRTGDWARQAGRPVARRGARHRPGRARERARRARRRPAEAPRDERGALAGDARLLPGDDAGPVLDDDDDRAGARLLHALRQRPRARARRPDRPPAVRHPARRPRSRGWRWRDRRGRPTHGRRGEPSRHAARRAPAAHGRRLGGAGGAVSFVGEAGRPAPDAARHRSACTRPRSSSTSATREPRRPLQPPNLAGFGGRCSTRCGDAQATTTRRELLRGSATPATGRPTSSTLLRRPAAAAERPGRRRPAALRDRAGPGLHDDGRNYLGWLVDAGPRSLDDAAPSRASPTTARRRRCSTCSCATRCCVVVGHGAAAAPRRRPPRRRRASPRRSASRRSSTSRPAPTREREPLRAVSADGRRGTITGEPRSRSPTYIPTSIGARAETRAPRRAARGARARSPTLRPPGSSGCSPSTSTLQLPLRRVAARPRDRQLLAMRGASSDGAATGRAASTSARTAGSRTCGPSPRTAAAGDLDATLADLPRGGDARCCATPPTAASSTRRR